MTAILTSVTKDIVAFLYHFYALSEGHLLSIFTFTIYDALY